MRDSLSKGKGKNCYDSESEVRKISVRIQAWPASSNKTFLLQLYLKPEGYVKCLQDEQAVGHCIRIVLSLFTMSLKSVGNIKN